MPRETVVRAALAGNPNVGKSTVFNALTGLRQHTGNWPGKTVEAAEGTFTCGGSTVILTDLPGIYSLSCHSAEEEAALAYLNTRPDVTVVVCDAGTLERNLILWGQITAMGLNVILCVNLMDEAEKRGITVDPDALRNAVGCPVVFTSARDGKGLEELRQAIVTHSGVKIPDCGEKSMEMGGHGWNSPPGWDSGCGNCGNCASCGGNAHCHPDLTKTVSTEELVRRGEEIAASCVRVAHVRSRDLAADRWLCGKYTAYPVMLLFTALLFFITICVSGYLSEGLEILTGHFLAFSRNILAPNLPPALASLLLDGILGTILQVISVMLPPMAIFFPLFTLLEDLGYLPRCAFNLDRCFASCGSCGKQSLTMLMGLGCNAAGVMGCRIIDSPRERLIAMITNSMTPCNGRLPILFAILALSGRGPLFSAAALILLMVLSAAVTLGVSRVLSGTVLKGEKSSFALELPPYRIPKIGQTLIRSLLDRCLFVLGRAVTAAAPAGAVIWFTVNLTIGGVPLHTHLTALLDPIGKAAAMDGVLLLSFILALPAAELMLPLAAAGYTLTGAEMPVFDGKTCIAVILFTIFHWPCLTTLLTMARECRHEPRGRLYVLLAAVIPTVIGFGLCVLVNLVM